MENLETFFKNEEKTYRQSITAKSETELKMAYHYFESAIGETVQWIEGAYKDYMHKYIKKNTLEYLINRNERYIIHWQNMIEIIVEELLKRS